MALSTPLATQAMGLGGPAASGKGPMKALAAGTTSQSQMAGDASTAPNASGGRSIAGPFLNFLNRTSFGQTTGSTGIGGAVLGGINRGVNAAGTNISNALAPSQGAAQANNAAQYFNAMYGPQQAQLAQQASDIANNQRFAGLRNDQSIAYAQQNAGLGQQMIDAEMDRRVNVPRTDLATLNNYLDTMQGQKANQLGVDQGYLQTQGSMADQALRAAQANTGQQRGLADRAYGQVTGNANTAHDVGVRDLMGNGASGGFGTAQQQGVQGFDTTRNQATSAAQLNKDATYQGLDYNDQQAQLANTNQHLDFSHQSNDLQAAYDQYKTGYTKDKADAANQQNYLDAWAKDYGIQSEQLKASLKNSLDGMGLDYAQTMSQLANASNSNNAQQVATAQAITQQIMANASQFPTTRPGTTPTPTPNTQKVKRI